MKIKSIVLAMASALAATSTQAAIITQWDFNVATGVNNSPAPSFGAGSATPVGMTNNANNADILAASGTPPSPDPAAIDNAWRVRGSVSNGYSGTVSLLSGARFNASTIGFEDISVRFELNATDGSPRYAQFQYTLDGTSFTSFGSLTDFNPGFDGFKSLSYDLSSISGADNNAAFGFKFVTAFSPVAFTNANGEQAANTAFQRANAMNQVYNGTAGNYRFDLVTFEGTAVPEPSMAGLLALSGIAALGRRVRRN